MMVSAFDRIVIAVPHLAEAGDLYRQLLGIEPAGIERDGTARAWFALPNTVIELVQSPGKHPLIQGVVFASAGGKDVDRSIGNSRGLDIRQCSPDPGSACRVQLEDPGPGCLRVDHLVLRTADAAGCIDLFGRRLGIRLALDKTVPEWGGRMLFFRVGKLTLEIIESRGEPVAADHFWGLAYQCENLEQTARQLAGRGVSLSGIRPGRKPGSLVATVNSHCLGIPTLLLQPG
ncbi:MAG: VOC family protein [Gammaproteobacteria bacterium]|nr:VOC family protein [Gammaproteobacteria bacterium]